MKSVFVVPLLIGAIAAPGFAQASQSYMDAQALSAAATGERFQSGTETFRMLPGSVVAEQPPAGAPGHRPPTDTAARTRPATAQTGGKVAARIGPYAVVLDTAIGAARSQSTATERSMAAAVNERTGRVVLVSPQVKLTGTTPATATLLAARTGGAIAYASMVDGSAVITYPSVERAQRAIATLQRSDGIAEASLVVMQAVRQPT